MDLDKAARSREPLTFWARLRLALWIAFSRRPGKPTVIDPRHLSDRMLADLGLLRPNQSWDESVGFWRD